MLIQLSKICMNIWEGIRHKKEELRIVDKEMFLSPSNSYILSFSNHKGRYLNSINFISSQEYEIRLQKFEKLQKYLSNASDWKTFIIKFQFIISFHMLWGISMMRKCPLRRYEDTFVSIHLIKIFPWKWKNSYIKIWVDKKWWEFLENILIMKNDAKHSIAINSQNRWTLFSLKKELNHIKWF